jgi:hypothetical protein
VHVGREIREFSQLHRPIVPIDFGGGISAAPWADTVQGLVLEVETGDKALAEGRPSPHVIDRIERSVTYTRRNRRIQRTFRVTLAGVVALILLGIVAVSIVQRDLATAREELADVEADAEVQRRVGESRRLAGDAAALRTSGDPAVSTAVLLAIEALDTSGTLEARQELSTGLALLPKSTAATSGNAIEKLVYHPDGQLIAAAYAKGGLAILDTRDRTFNSLGFERDRIVGLLFSPSGRFLAMATPNQLAVFETVTRTPLFDPIRRFPVNMDAQFPDLAFSPDEGLLAYRSGPSSLTLLDLQGGGRRDLDTDRRFASAPVYGLAFSPDGRRLAMGQASSLQVWSLDGEWRAEDPYAVSGSSTGEIRFRDERSLVSVSRVLEVVALNRAGAVRSLGEANQLAMSADGRRLAALKPQAMGMPGSIRVWKWIGEPELAFSIDVPDAELLRLNGSGTFLGARIGAREVRVWDAATGALAFA